jgi:hypothetical protein
VDLIGRSDYIFTVQHKHNDGSWGELSPRPRHHDPADEDPERAWAEGRLYVCNTCDEEVRVIERPPASGIPGGG